MRCIYEYYYICSEFSEHVFETSGSKRRSLSEKCNNIRYMHVIRQFLFYYMIIVLRPGGAA